MCCPSFSPTRELNQHPVDDLATTVDQVVFIALSSRGQASGILLKLVSFRWKITAVHFADHFYLLSMHTRTVLPIADCDMVFRRERGWPVGNYCTKSLRYCFMRVTAVPFVLAIGTMARFPGWSLSKEGGQHAHRFVYRRVVATAAGTRGWVRGDP